MSTDQDLEGLPKPGETLLGKYRVDRVLGAGGMGVVVAATHVHLDEPVAIKFLLSKIAGMEDAIKRFSREARAAAKIKSEHVARVTDIGQLDSGAAYMVMEYLDGEDLADRVARGPLPVDVAVDFVLQAAEGLAEAHKHGIIHRDLKPANLFVSKKGDGSDVVKVLDFGISKIVQDQSSPAEQSLTQTSTMMGSPLYMAPEQMKSARDADSRADIWALGTILYELCSGQRPFQGGSLPELCSKILIEPPVPLTTHMPAAPAILVSVVSRCLQKNPDDRYVSLAELANELAPLGTDSATRSAKFIRGVLGDVSTPLAGRYDRQSLPDVPPGTMAAGPAVVGQTDPGSISGGPQPAVHLAGTVPGVPDGSGGFPAATALPQGAPAATVMGQAPMAGQTAVGTTTGGAAIAAPPPRSREEGGKLPMGAILGGGAAAALLVVVALWAGGGGEESETDADTTGGAATAAPSASAAKKAEDKTPNPWVKIEAASAGTVLGSDENSEAYAHFSGLHSSMGVTAPTYAFDIQSHEVTWKEFLPWLEKNSGEDYEHGWKPSSPALLEVTPATGMMGSAAKKYCESIGGRLPTEAEWEWAARGPQLDLFPSSQAQSQPTSVHAFRGDLAQLVPVKSTASDQRETTGGKLYDMLGNAREWTQTEWVYSHGKLRGQKVRSNDQVVDGELAVRGFHVDKTPKKVDAEGHVCKEGVFGCTVALPSQGLAYRSHWCGQTSCMEGIPEAFFRRKLRGIGFRCARDAK